MAHRPQKFEDFNGQTPVVENLRILTASAKRQDKPLAHLLLVGPAGLGKTTLGMHVLPNEMGVEARFVNCAAIDKPQQLTSVLATMRANQILFMDEIHVLPAATREHLLTAMEDQTISVTIGDPPNEEVMTVQLQPFTIIAATTRQGTLDGPLRTRFQQILRLEPYNDQEMAEIILWHLRDSGSTGTLEAVETLARCAKGVARLGVNLLASAIDTLMAMSDKELLDKQVATATLERLGYRDRLNPEERRYIDYLKKVRRAGLGAIAAALDETPQTIEEVYEPWLLRKGMIVREPQGRRLTELGKTQ